MGHFSDREDSVRVDFFKMREDRSIGAWYTTEAVLWKWYKGCLLDEAFAGSLIRHLTDLQSGRVRLSGMIAVCLEPHFEHAYPIALEVDRAARICSEKRWLVERSLE